VGAVLLAGLACTPDDPSAARPVFRHLDTTRGEIRLGSALGPTWLSPSAPAAAIVSLPRGVVTGAQSVSVRRDADGRVREIMLNYEQTTDFPAQVARYRGELGPPFMHDRPAGPEAAERVAWRDARTTFELVRDPRRSVSTVYARLSDREVEPRPRPSGAGE
jgi:hypothetical protein